MSNYPYPSYGMMPQQPMPQQMYSPQTQAPAPAAAPAYACKPVTSREEAIAAATNYLGLGDIMPDLAHGVIYLKRFNRDTGVSDFLEFRYSPQTQAPAQAEYVTRTAFEEALAGVMEELNNLKKRGKKAAESD